MPSARTAQQYFQEDCSVFTVNSDAGILALVGRGSVRTDVDLAENHALNDTTKKPKALRYGTTLEFEIAADSGLAEDFQADAVAMTAVPFVLEYDAGQGYRAGSFIIESVEDTLEDAINVRVTARLVGALTTTKPA